MLPYSAWFRPILHISGGISMTDRQQLIVNNVDTVKQLILDAERWIWAHPQTGYTEWQAHDYLAEKYEALGYTLVKAGNIPGFYTDVETGKPGPKVAIFGELDALDIANHPESVNGMTHCCGHNAQSAALLGIAAALKQPHALDGLCGSIRFISVPAEELIELGYRESLRKQGIIKYFGGKVEFIHRGYFDGVDMAMMIHSGKLPEGKALSISDGCNGCVTKNITFKGISAHAGGSPENGRNALYAATCALNSVNALRETFTDNDHIRFHPIITEAGLAVNAIPETAKVESYVRGASFDAIRKYNTKVNQALAASAAAIGCNVELDDHPGYFPLNNDKNMAAVMKEAMETVAGPDSVVEGGWGTGSTDMGDVSAIMPVLHPHANGSIGTGHGKDYYVQDKKLGCLYPAECLVLTAAKLLADDAALGKKVIAEAKPYFKSKEEYLAAIDAITMDKDAVVYNEDGTITLNFTK